LACGYKPTGSGALLECIESFVDIFSKIYQALFFQAELLVCEESTAGLDAT
jgi:hypothetical protein